jgi:hypothetical protein
MRINTLEVKQASHWALAVLSLAILLLLQSCERRDSITPTDIPNESEQITAAPEITDNGLDSPIHKPDLADMSDEELLSVINAFETCLTDENELVFNKPIEIPTDILYMFFLQSLGDVFSEDYEYYKSEWLKDDGYFHIPVEDITEQLRHYFLEFNFNPASLEDYDPVENAVITASITGSGDSIDSRVVEKTYRDDILTVKVSFFVEPEKDTIEYTYKTYYRELIKLKTYIFQVYESGYYLLSVKMAPPPFSQEEAQYNGIKIDSTVEELINILGQPDEIFDVIGLGDERDYTAYRYGETEYRALIYPNGEYPNDIISYINIRETEAGAAPRGICIGDSFEEVLSKFPQEYDYTTDEFRRIYGVRTSSGAGGMVDRSDSSIILTTKKVEPFMRIYFEDNKVVSIIICRRWM